MKRFLFLALALSILFFGSLQLYKSWFRPTSKKELEKRLAQLPPLTLKGLDGSDFLLEKGSSLILIYFNSECEHCQAEMKDIMTNISLFSGSTLVLMSSQTLEEIQSFSAGLDLSSYENIHFAKISHEQLAQVFGTLSLPQIFVYSPEGKLVTLFSGATKAEVIAGFLGGIK